MSSTSISDKNPQFVTLLESLQLNYLQLQKGLEANAAPQKRTQQIQQALP